MFTVALEKSFFLYESGKEGFKRYQCGIVIMRKPALSGFITSETKITERCFKGSGRKAQRQGDDTSRRHLALQHGGCSPCPRR